MAGPVWRNEQERQILAEVYKSFATKFDSQRNPIAYQEWFRGAGIIQKNSQDQKMTLIVNCNYKPLLVMKEVLALAEKHGLLLELREVDPEGKPKE
jgi:hypothetical protein